MIRKVRAAITALADEKKAAVLRGFFKTGPGEYAEGDIFIGVTVPKVRSLLRLYADLPLTDIRTLLTDPVHEMRLLALLVMVGQFRKADAAGQRKLYDIYLAHTAHINNWDLVDLSAEHIVGPVFLQYEPGLLDRLARSSRLWERRISIIATFYHIKRNDPSHTFRIADLLRQDRHDLIHKAVGWMLREVGKRCSVKAAQAFLKTRHKHMPRTMLRYAIERFPEPQRRQYLIKSQ